MNWPPYPSTKPSGVEWLGSVPSHWHVRQLKWGSPVRRGASPRPIDDPKYFDDDGEWSWVRIADVSASNGLLKETTQRLSQLGSSLSVKLNPGSLFVSIAGTVGKPCITTIPACIHDGFVYFPDLDLNPQYLFRIFESGECYKGLGKFGTQLNLNTDTIGSIRMPVPPPPEQEMIVEFVDRETAKIDVLIGKQEQLIATLREDRTATIAHAVTKGLDPDVVMKDSGVPWIGKIPRHWTLGKVKHGFSVVLGKMYQGERQSPSDELLPHLKAGSLSEALELDLYDPMLCWFTPDERRKLSIRKDDLLVVEGGATYGRCAIVNADLPGWGFQKSLNRVRVRDGDSIHFLAYLIQTATQIGHVSILCGKATIPHFTAEKLESLEWPHPPLAEQRSIVDFLDRRCAKIDTLITKAAEVIETLREYRSALITDAVTGKIDVRGAA